MTLHDKLKDQGLTEEAEEARDLLDQLEAAEDLNKQIFADHRDHLVRLANMIDHELFWQHADPRDTYTAIKSLIRRVQGAG